MKRLIAIGAADLLLVAALWLLPWPQMRFWVSFALIWFLPGLAWIFPLEKSGNFTKLESYIVSLGLNFMTVLFCLLLLAYIPGPISKRSLYFFPLVLLSVPFFVNVIIARVPGKQDLVPRFVEIEGETNQPFWRRDWFWLLLIIIFAASLRLISLGYSEFQGDEAAAIVKTAQIITGDDPIIFEHKKGPVELLMPLSGWVAAGITNEWMSRMPFAWASILVTATIFIYGRRQEGLISGAIAGSLLAIEGYLVGFGRIVQYQSVVLLLSSLALFSLLIYHKQGSRYLLVLAAAFFAIGTWAHYDVVLFLPAGLLLILLHLKNDWSQWQRSLPYLITAAVLGLFLSGLFYIPFFQSAQAEGTIFYVSGRIGGEQTFYNHLRSTFNRGFVYDSFYLLILIFGGLTAQILFTWRRHSKGAFVIAILLLLLVLVTLFSPSWWEYKEQSWAWLVMGALLLGSLMAPNQDPGTRAIWLWLGVPALFYLFFVAVPLTHVYTTIPAGILLAAMGIYKTRKWLARRRPMVSRVVIGTAMLLFLIGLVYSFIIFVNHNPEYLRTYENSRLAIYWTPFGENLPEEGLFGFPYRAGWKTVGYLMDSGEISGSFDSNEERDVTDFYMRSAMRFDCATPDYYVIADNVQDEVDVRFDQIQAEYSPVFEIEVGGRPKTTIYKKRDETSERRLTSEDFDGKYDSGTTPSAVAFSSPAWFGSKPSGFAPVNAQIGDFAELVGYKIATENAYPGGYIDLVLLWHAMGNAPIDYQVFTHLHDGQEMRGQLDGQPVCSSAPTSRWHKGTYIIDPYRIPINAAAATGLVPLTVGLYDLASLQRVPVVNSTNPADVDSVFITDVEIQESG